MKKRVIVLLVAFAVVVFAAFAITALRAIAHRSLESDLYRQLTTSGDTKASVSALDRVLKTPEDFSPVLLYFACGVAYREGRLEDAGFLFYIARLRVSFDDALFPHTGTGGSNPMIAMAAANQQLGEVVNSAIWRDRKVYAKVLERVRLWKPRLVLGYAPVWKYSGKGSMKQADQVFADQRKTMIDRMSGFCTLLQDDAYFSASGIVQDYNLKIRDPKRPSKEAYDAAIRTLERIEKEKGIECVTAVIKKKQ